MATKTKIRVNISLDKAIHARGRRLARSDRRTFSNKLEQLIDQEWMRKFQPTLAPAEEVKP